MKKLLLVLMVVALASFLFVGCLPTTPAEGEGEGEGEPEVCPTVSITSEVEIAGKKYIKGASQTITVTFAEATDPVSVFVADAIKDNPTGVPTSAVELVMYPDADKKVWTGKYRFGTSTIPGEGDADDIDCLEGYIYVSTCTTCAPCKFPYVVDENAPCSSIRVYEYPGTGCTCGGVNVRFVTPSISDCSISSNCGDYCSGLDIYKVDVYKADPFGTCCDVPCLSPIASCEGAGCDIDCTISCLDYSAYFTTADNDFFVVATLTDKVGNSQRYYAKMKVDTDEITSIVEYPEQTIGSATCADWTGTPLGTGAVVTGYGYTLTIGNNAELYGTCK